MSNLAALLTGAGIGAVIGMTALWSLRAELKQGWRQRRAELFGAETETPTSSSASRDQNDRRPEDLKVGRLAIGVSALAALGSAALAVQTSDGTVKAANIVVCAVSLAAIGVLLIGE